MKSHRALPIGVLFCLLTSALPLFGADTLIPAGSVWKYLDSGVGQGTDWRGSAYVDSDWGIGPAQLGFGDGDEATVINQVGLNGEPIITAYFRKTFSVLDPSIYASFAIRLLRDDGGIVYINGVEVFRSGMPTNAVTYSTLAFTAEGPSENTFFTRLGPVTVLVPGENLIAVEVHQSSPASSDMGFDLILLGNPPPPNRAPFANPQTVTTPQNTARTINLTGSDPDGNPLTFSIVTEPSHGALSGNPPGVTYTPASGYTGPDSFTFKVNDGQLDSSTATVSIDVLTPPAALVASNAVWRYLDTGVDPGTAWRGLGYDDSAWPSGPAQLGFGDGDEATVINRITPNGAPLITAYFRRTIFVTNVLQIASLTINLWRDDGAIVYVNGVEVLRDNMPFGPVNYFTLAAGNAGDDGNALITATVPAGMLGFGPNVVAVEVHQVNGLSSDLSFMLELRGNIGPTTNHPPVALSQSLTTDEDAPLPITLQGTDPDLNLLAFTWTQPLHGLVSGDAPNLTYLPQPDYAGLDSFNFTVFDGRGGSSNGTINITITSVNDPPVPFAQAASVDQPENFVRNLVAVAKNNSDAGVTLDASFSGDIDSFSLTYAWYLDGSSTAFSTEPTVTGALPVGNHSITLLVSDGTASASDTITVQVLTPCDLVEILGVQVEAAPLEKNERKLLLGTLKLACTSFDSGNLRGGIRYLMHFQARVDQKLVRDNPNLAAALIASAQTIIDAVQ